jgi:diguanylate cyclase (GGDEF)-like protein
MSDAQQGVGHRVRQFGLLGIPKDSEKGVEGISTMMELVDLLANTYRWRMQELEAELAAARTKVAELESKIESDPLLNILNRRGFERELQRAMKFAQRYQTSNAVVFIDLDNFKTVNDRFGHLAGDAALQRVSSALIRDLRASDIVARFGGDEFAVLLWNISETNARAKAVALEQIIAGVEICFAGTSVSIGASAGVTMLKDTDTLADVIRRADANMYQRKQGAQRRVA